MARRARRSPLFAPVALILIVAFAALAGIAASKGLPTGVRSAQAPRPALSSGVALGHPIIPHVGYAGHKAPPILLAPKIPTKYSEPKVISSHNGVLRATFRAHIGPAVINGRRYSNAWTYTGTYPGPILKVNPGDTLKIRFTNDLPKGQVTNVHFHGFRVDPDGISDNVLRTIFPAATSKLVGQGKTVPIVVHIPLDHEQGLYWYHPHFHGRVDGQVYGGLAGMIEIGDPLAPFPWLHHIKQRVMELQSPELGANGKLVSVGNANVNKETTLVNGHYQPTLHIHPNELQLWRVANTSNDHWYKLYLGGMKLYVIGEDGNPVARVWTARRLLVPPAKRFEFLVRGPKRGHYDLKSINFNQGFDVFSTYTVLHLVSWGKTWKRLPVPTIVSPTQAAQQQAELDAPVYRHRTLTFSIQNPFPKNLQAFKINGRLFNGRYINEKVRLNTVEEWLLRNTSKEDHPFHIHTNDFLVEKVNGHKVTIHGFQDTVAIPHVRHGKPGTVLIRQEYRDFQGYAVFHCHILFHEDNAMMGIIKFGPPAGPPIGPFAP